MASGYRTGQSRSTGSQKKKRKAFYGPKGFNLLADVENFLESRSKQAVEQDSTFQW